MKQKCYAVGNNIKIEYNKKIACDNERSTFDKISNKKRSFNRAFPIPVCSIGNFLTSQLARPIRCFNKANESRERNMMVTTTTCRSVAI